MKAGDKHGVFPHRPWLPFVPARWKQRKSQKKERRGKIIDLSVTVCLCHENGPTARLRPRWFGAPRRRDVTLAARESCCCVVAQRERERGEKNKTTFTQKTIQERLGRWKRAQTSEAGMPRVGAVERKKEGG